MIKALSIYEFRVPFYRNQHKQQTTSGRQLTANLIVDDLANHYLYLLIDCLA